MWYTKIQLQILKFWNLLDFVYQNNFMIYPD